MYSDKGGDSVLMDDDENYNERSIQQQVIENYQRDEQMMILVFAQWCVNNDFDPSILYKRAYPNQNVNISLQQALELTVSKEESGEIDDSTLLSVLSMFDNDELAYVISQEIEKMPRK
jgi:hypothetical protein